MAMKNRWSYVKLFIALPLFAVAIALNLARIGNSQELQSTPTVAGQTSTTTPILLDNKDAITSVNITVDNMLNYTNQRRVANGLQPVTLNVMLNSSAQAKADDMVTRNYWSHDTPDGEKPWFFITNAGYSYSKAGENLGCGFADAPSVLAGWMNSPTHRANILTPEYTEVGFGIITKTTNYLCGDSQPGNYSVIVQHFATPY